MTNCPNCPLSKSQQLAMETLMDIGVWYWSHTNAVQTKALNALVKKGLAERVEGKSGPGWRIKGYVQIRKD